MAFSYKTPGAYIEEIVKLPPSVAQVETAIPVFIGVTQKATEVVASDLNGVSKRISSLADYEFYYGLPDVAEAKVEVNLALPSNPTLTKAYTKNMYYAILHYFENGGGPCFIHSVGLYGDAVDATNYKTAIGKLDLVDEVTLIVLPDIGLLGDNAKIYDVYNIALQKVADLQDKFVIIDVRPETVANKIDLEKSKSSFRSAISNNPDSIKYGAAYFPNLNTTYSYDFSASNITMVFATDIISASPSANLLNNLDYRAARSMFAINSVVTLLNDAYFKDIPIEVYPAKSIEIFNKTNAILSYFKPAQQTALKDNQKKLSDELSKQGDTEKAAAKIKFNFSDAGKQRENFLKNLSDRVLELYTDMSQTVKDDLQNNKGVDNGDFTKLSTTFLSKITPFFNSIFEAKLKEAFMQIPVELPPSPAMAGIYAKVDRTRGVWKAPANVSVNAVVKPAVPMSDLDQEDFNVDAENGKSINCIRAFVGRGNLVWGARTLAGNNNEWRYVNVRRFFNMVEESCQNASRQFIFEPNDANTWVRVKGMIDNFLTNLWRVGALQGAKPEHAFYTAVGLNQTMTQDDILNGLMIVEIGLAVVRPAEFIVLRFSHKLAVS